MNKDFNRNLVFLLTKEYGADIKTIDGEKEFEEI